MKKENFLVTGAAGLIGLELCKQLSVSGYGVHFFDLGEQVQYVKKLIPKNVKTFYGSVLDLSSLRAAMQECSIIIHLAALLGVARSEKDRLKCLEINIEGTKKVMDCAIQHKVRKIVFASSSEVYGEPLNNPIKEDAITQGKTVYAITKLVGEELCKAYSQKYPIDYVILRYFNCYGPYQTAQFVISKFIKNVMNNQSPVVHGNGNQLRSYTYVSDTASATIKAALNDKANSEVFNIGNDRNIISVSDLANLVIKASGKNKLHPVIRNNFVDCDRNADREIYSRYCDSSKAKRILDWEAKVSLEDGIKKVFKTGVIFDRWSNLYDDTI